MLPIFYLLYRYEKGYGKDEVDLRVVNIGTSRI
jgi:hypothetical protein